MRISGGTGSISLFPQALLGAKVDGSGLSLHADRRTRWDQDDNLPVVLGGEWSTRAGVELGGEMAVAKEHLLPAFYWDGV